MSKIFIKNKIYLTLIILGISMFVLVFFHAMFYAPVSEIYRPSYLETNGNSNFSKPKKLLIPTLGIDANVQYVGLTFNGKMGVPNNFTDVGWYKYGSIPGQDGNAVIDGHVDNGFALPGVFKNLSNLKPGDDIYIEDVNGKKTHFIVEGSASYDKDAKVDEIFSKNGKPLLRLITCTGTWLKDQKTHDKRLVVTAVLKT